VIGNGNGNGKGFVEKEKGWREKRKRIKKIFKINKSYTTLIRIHVHSMH